MNEKEFGRRIRSRLEDGTRQIDGITLKKLEAARHQALSRARSAERKLVMASNAVNPRGASVLHMPGSDDQRSTYLKALFAGLVLLALMGGWSYWQMVNSEDEEGDQGLLDAKMLSSELPLNTFVHPDFKEWVDNSR